MNQTASWRALTRTLRAECDAYRELSKILTEEQPLLVKMDHQQLFELNDRKEEILHSICQLEHERTSQLQELAGFHSLDELTKWIVNAQFADAKEIQAALNELIDTGKSVKQQSEGNAALVFRALYVVQEALSLIYTGLGRQPVYGDSGQLTFPFVATSLNLKG